MTECEHPRVERYIVQRCPEVFRCRCSECGKAWLERDS